MATYASLVDVADRNIQNVQDLAVVWGELANGFDNHDAELIDSYAVTGKHDFLLVFETADREGMAKSGLALHEHGLSGRTMEIRDTDEFAALVDGI